MIVIANSLEAFKLTRVIVASDENPTYSEFWPITSRMWKEVVGLTPTLAFISDNPKKIQKGFGDVLCFKPIKDIPTSFQAQVIRLLLPALFPEDYCIISDIDMIPLQKNYFIDSVKSIADNCFVVYRDKAYAPDYPQYPMCYLAAQGKTFAEIFNIRTKKDIKKIMKEWYQLGYGYTTDERMLYKKLHEWSAFKSRCILLGEGVGPRIDRIDWQYDKQKLRNNFYIDSHMLRPYSTHKQQIDTLIQDLLKS